jgi:uncharacterized protein YoaH (UPF0181 family)
MVIGRRTPSIRQCDRLEMNMKTDITKEDVDRANERIRELVAEGFSPAVALGLAWEEAIGRRAHPDGALIITLLQAPNEEGLTSPSFQEEIREIQSDLRNGGADAEADWITQDAVDAWCGYLGVIKVVVPTVVSAISAVLIAYMKLRAGRKVQVELDGKRLMINEATPEEVGRVLRLLEDGQSAKLEKPTDGARASKSRSYGSRRNSAHE